MTRKTTVSKLETLYREVAASARPVGKPAPTVRRDRAGTGESGGTVSVAAEE